MRGALEEWKQYNAQVRIIPADAGSTTPAARQAWLGPDHPRGCGEHGSVQKNGAGEEGSSPRMRGAQSGDATIANGRRIIPADAGSTP